MSRKKLYGAILAILGLLLFSMFPHRTIETGYAQELAEVGYTCFPSCLENDGRFLSLPGLDMASFSDGRIVAWIGVPAGQATFELGIFDGDSGRNDAGEIDMFSGNWDTTEVETIYTLYADPLKDGQGLTIVGQWYGNQDLMPNNAWFNVTLDTGAAARAPSGNYFYRLETSWADLGSGINTIKVRSSGYVSLGRADLVNVNFGIVGMIATFYDIPIIYPEWDGDWNDPGPSTYSGNWSLYFHLPEDVSVVEFWDGDFDRGSWDGTSLDTDDPNTEGIPPWANEEAVDEGASGIGQPADDSAFVLFQRSPSIWYELVDPIGNIYVNDNPSGTEEWERFVLSTDPSILADAYADEIPAGWYEWHIAGLDMYNTTWIRTNYEIFGVDIQDDPQPGPPVWPPAGTYEPRTIGYWKNNVEKVLIQGKTQGVQETRESLEAALNNIAIMSPLFRSGIDMNNPAPLSDVVRLTDEEANAILQRDNGDSMLDRALQQNLATWLNLGSGKIGMDRAINLDLPSGPFSGTVWEALQEAQDIILYHRDDPVLLERAKDIADMINNGHGL
jgi:hypothetical protein